MTTKAKQLEFARGFVAGWHSGWDAALQLLAALAGRVEK